MADIYLSKGQSDLAYDYLQDARRNTYLAGKDDNYLKLYAALSRYFRQNGDVAHTLLYQDSMLYYQNRLNTEMDDNLKVQAEYRLLKMNNGCLNLPD